MPKFDQAKSRILVNAGQYFDGINREVWEYKVGSYEVCRKWLSERKGESLSADDITCFAAIVQAIEDSLREQANIEEAISTHGGWPSAFVTTRSSS
jgi:hypothetical protein